MSRSDSRNFEYPTELGYMHSNDQGFAQSNTAGYALPDKRGSGGAFDGVYPLTRSVIPRSVQVQDLEHGFNIDNNWTNRHTPAHLSSSNHHHLRPAPQPNPINPFYHTTSYSERDPQSFRHNPHSPPANQTAHHPAQHVPPLASSRSALWWGELEPWMDEEYAKQVCGLMGWDPVNVKVPHPAPDAVTGQQPNNPGYCFLTFPSPAHAASVLAQINKTNGSNPITMPNSSKPFVLNWASSVPSVGVPLSPTAINSIPSTQQHFPTEYSIFVGDLAPETSNSDLVAVFRNPVLGLRNDREPKFIRPFLSCKSAKIMLDPVTGVSRGYGFVRFTDEADQQRALIEMHGLYCLSRPMRISPATAKFKPAGTVPAFDLPQVHFPHIANGNGAEQPSQSVTIALPLPSSNQTKSVSAPIAGSSPNGSNSTANQGPSASSSSNNVNSGSPTASQAFASTNLEDMHNLPNEVLVQIAQQYASGSTGRVNPSGSSGPNSISSNHVQDEEQNGPARYTISEESWKHHAQARAILGNLIGPNGEQLTSADPYNTTVFVGGLSPLISEETLRTFFAPFGDIHYVKVPVGKHCGFVQFVRKADAERAIEKMQGFPVGGSRIRLSWGRSQYKAAQAAAQAAQAAALQAQYVAPVPASVNSSVTPEQALQLLQKFGIQGYFDKPAGVAPDASAYNGAAYGHANGRGLYYEDKLRPSLLPTRDNAAPSSFDGYNPASYGSRPPGQIGGEHRQSLTLTSFSPFSPDPNLYNMGPSRRESIPSSRPELLPHPSRSYAPGFGPAPLQTDNGANGGGETSPGGIRPSSASRYNSFLDSSAPSFQVNRAPVRVEATPISRPSSGQTPAGIVPGSGSGSGTGTTPGREAPRAFEGTEQDLIQDLNGTLASLDLDQGWKSPAESSEGSVQFKMSRSAGAISEATS